MEEDFSVLPQGETSNVYQLRLTPKQAAAAIGLLDIEVSKETFDILQALITDPLGNTTRVSFTNIERETVLGDDLFRFELPPGIDLVEPLLWLVNTAYQPSSLPSTLFAGRDNAK